MIKNKEFKLRYVESSKELDILIEKIGINDMGVCEWLAAVGSGKMKESTMNKYIEYLDPEYISFLYKLSPKFISKHKDILDWCSISSFQNIANMSFIEEHLEYINLESLINDNVNFTKSKDKDDILKLYYKLKNNEVYKTLWETIKSRSFFGRDRSHYGKSYKIKNSKKETLVQSNSKNKKSDKVTKPNKDVKVKPVEDKPTTRKKREFKYENRTREQLKATLTKRKVKFKASDNKETLVQLCRDSAN